MLFSLSLVPCALSVLPCALFAVVRCCFFCQFPDFSFDIHTHCTIRLQLQAEAEVAELKKSFRRGTGISAREKELEMQAGQDAADREVLMLEIHGLKKQHQSAARGKNQEFNSWMANHQNESKMMIHNLMEAFEEEMTAMRERCSETEKMLECATRDLEYLMEENDNLKSRLAHK